MLPVESCFIDTDYSKQTITECPFIANHTAEFEKHCVKRPLKIDKTKVLMRTSSLMNLESITECSPWSILQYF